MPPGARYKGRSVGSIGDIGCFSFHAVKNLAMGDGGALTLNNQQWMQRCKRLRWLGIDKGTWDRTATDKSYWWQYFVDEIGLKCHLNDIAAAIGLVQLRRLEAMNAPPPRDRPPLQPRPSPPYDFMETPPADDADFQSSWHIYCLKVPQRDDLCAFLQAAGDRHGRTLHADPPLLVLRQQAAPAPGRRGLPADRLAAHVSRHDRHRRGASDRFGRWVLSGAAAPRGSSCRRPRSMPPRPARRRKPYPAPGTMPAWSVCRLAGRRHAERA